MLQSLLSNVYLVKYDLETVEPIRDSNGRCIKVKQGKRWLLTSSLCVSTMYIISLQRWDGWIEGCKRSPMSPVPSQRAQKLPSYFYVTAHVITSV